MKIKIISIGILIIFIGAIFINIGVIPIGMTIQPPSGNSQVMISVAGNILTDNYNDDCASWFPDVITDTKGIKKLDYMFFQTDIAPDAVMTGYKNSLIKAGYSLYDGKEGTTEYEGSTIYYAVYTKIFIGVAIVSVSSDCCGSCVFYSTAPANIYYEIRSENDLDDFLGFI